MAVSGVSKGDICPCCNRGKLYHGEDRKLLQFTGHAPIEVNRFVKEVLRCNACNKEFIAGGNIEKWTDSAKSTAVLEKCSGMPFYRLSNIQDLYNIPIAESTLWYLCKLLWDDVGKVMYKALLEESSKRKNLYVDDTRARVLDVTIENNKKILNGEKAGRSCNSTIVCSNNGLDQEIILYITKQGYCGENIAPLIESADKCIMSDASTMTRPKIAEELLSTMNFLKCMSHGRNKFADIRSFYPEECNYFLEQIKSIYSTDDKAKAFDPESRRLHHNKHSIVYINNIYKKIEHLFREKIIEPNSHLGQAMRYWVNNRSGLTKFLIVAGFDLDNNRCERNLKRLILQRKNSLFFKTLSSAEVLSGLSSIIATSKANNISSYDYLNWLQANVKLVNKTPSDYLPWKYLEYIKNTEKIAA